MVTGDGDAGDVSVWYQCRTSKPLSLLACKHRALLQKFRERFHATFSNSLNADDNDNKTTIAINQSINQS